MYSHTCKYNYSRQYFPIWFFRESDLLAALCFFLRLQYINSTISASNSNATAAPVTPPATAPTDGPEDASLAATVGVCVNVGVLLAVAK